MEVVVVVVAVDVVVVVAVVAAVVAVVVVVVVVGPYRVFDGGVCCSFAYKITGRSSIHSIACTKIAREAKHVFSHQLSPYRK